MRRLPAGVERVGPGTYRFAWWSVLWWPTPYLLVLLALLSGVVGFGAWFAAAVWPEVAPRGWLDKAGFGVAMLLFTGVAWVVLGWVTSLLRDGKTVTLTDHGPSTGESPTPPDDVWRDLCLARFTSTRSELGSRHRRVLARLDVRHRGPLRRERRQALLDAGIHLDVAGRPTFGTYVRVAAAGLFGGWVGSTAGYHAALAVPGLLRATLTPTSPAETMVSIAVVSLLTAAGVVAAAWWVWPRAWRLTITPRACVLRAGRDRWRASTAGVLAAIADGPEFRLRATGGRRSFEAVLPSRRAARELADQVEELLGFAASPRGFEVLPARRDAG